MKDKKEKRTVYKMNRTYESINALINKKEKISDVDIESSKENFGERLKCYRIMRGMSQKELSECSGINPVSIALYETGKSLPAYEMILRIAKRLNVTPNELMGIKNLAQSGIINTKDFSKEFKLIREKIAYPYGVMLSDDELKEFIVRYCLEELSRIDKTELLLNEILK